MAFNGFDSAQTDITIGNLIITGYTDGEFLTMTPKSDDWTYKKGADGDSVASRTNDDSFDVEIKLLQTAAVNGDLLALRELQLASAPAGQHVSFQVSDRKNGSLFTGVNLLFMALPVFSMGQEAGEYSWKFVIDKMLVRQLNTLSER